MKSTLADNKQLFNVKKIAAAGLTPDAIPEGQLGFVNDATGLTVDTLPNKFSIISKLNGKLYYSFDTIEKTKMKNITNKDYTPGKINIWKTLIQSCHCINGVKLLVNIDEASLIQRDGLTWTHKDFVVEVSPQELSCYCSCSGTKSVYENNVLTMLLYQKVNALNSPFYEAEVQLEDGSVVADVPAFVEQNKGVNTDDDETNDGPVIYLVIKGKPTPAPLYRDIDVNYVYPRGVRLTPALMVDEKVATEFTQIQPLTYEIGAGYDMRAEEWDNMNYYTNLNNYPRLSDGLPNPDITYQFENNTNYNVVNFEFFTDKVERNNGDKRLFGIILGTSDATVYSTLKTMFSL